MNNCLVVGFLICLNCQNIIPRSINQKIRNCSKCGKDDNLFRTKYNSEKRIYEALHGQKAKYNPRKQITEPCPCHN
jgi:hypothetical protein